MWVILFRLVFFSTWFIFSSSSAPSSTAAPLAHCLCRCCAHDHLAANCSSNPSSFPLPHPITCDSAPHAPQCSLSFCNTHFTDQCKPPLFWSPACVSDRGPVADWLPFILSVLTLTLFAVVFINFARKGPRYDPEGVTLLRKATITH